MGSSDERAEPAGKSRPEPPNIARLWEQSKPGMFERVDTLERVIAMMVVGNATDDHVAEAQRIAHRIAGTAGMFGFSEASRVARTIEETLEHQPSDAHQLADLAIALIDSFRS